MRTIHLVRHGEVHNPDHVVYADLDGFGLSDRGAAQAEAAGAFLRGEPIAAVVHSPLQRAVETAQAIAAACAATIEPDPDLTEWLIGRRWAGVVWEDLPSRFPGELEAYLEHPADLPFAPEPIGTVAARMGTAIGAALERHHSGGLVVVSHQDPIQAVRLALTGRELATLQQDKPQHAEVITLLRTDDATPPAWEERSRWAPQQGGAFPPVAGSEPLP
jgi:broad specificity phosphatase PhoE